MIHRFPGIYFIAVLFFTVAFAMGGCRESVLINSKVSPSDNTIGLYDTSLDCITHTFYEDSAETGANFSGVPIYHGVGGYYDPFFGTMLGSTYFQVVPATFGPNLMDSLNIDSVVLVLPYSGYTFGDTANKTLTQTYQVFRLTDSLSLYSSYYSFDSKAIDAAFPLSDPVTVNVHSLADSFGYTFLAKNYPGLRIKLKTPYIVNRLKSAQGTTGGATPIPDFIKSFYGVCVRVADTRSTSSAIPYFQLDGNDAYTNAGILVYHHLTGSDSAIVMPFSFDRRYCVQFNEVRKSYSHAPVNNLFNSSAANDQIIALQNLPGATVDVVIPGISKLPAGIINKAELQLPILPGYGNNVSNGGTDSGSLVPVKLYPNGVGNGTYPGGITAGLTYPIADYYPIGHPTTLYIMDGRVHAFERGGKTIYAYTIDIPREVMTSIKAGNDTLHLHINGTQDFYGAYHLVAGGGNYPDPIYRPKLFVVYSKLTN